MKKADGKLLFFVSTIVFLTGVYMLIRNLTTVGNHGLTQQSTGFNGRLLITFSIVFFTLVIRVFLPIPK